MALASPALMDIAAAQAPPPLHDLLGASFVFNTTINALAWDGDAAYFGLADGAIVRLLSQWPGAPHLAPRPGGGIELVASAAPPPPPLITGVHRGAVLALAADPLGGVVSGGADGRFLRLANGEITLISERPGKPITAVAAGRGGRRACAAGRRVDVSGPEPKRLSLPAAVTALGYDPAGLHLAVGFEGGVSLEACAIRRNPLYAMNGPARLLAWNADGSRIAAKCPGGTAAKRPGGTAAKRPGGVVLRDRAAPDWQYIDTEHDVTALAFTSDGLLAIGTQASVDVWDAHSGRRPIGRSGVTAPIACHPSLGLVACADHHGRIVLCRPGLRDVMVIRDAGAAPIALAFAAAGQALAFATDDGEAGTVILPDSLFRRAMA